LDARYVVRVGTSQTADVQCFSKVPRDYGLARDEVHVWFTRIRWPSIRIQEIARHLSTAEREKVERFHFQMDAERHVVGRALARMLLGHLLGVTPRDLHFRYNSFGKPLLRQSQNERRIAFNISHSGKLVLIALAADREIGVDVEQIDEKTEIDAVAGRFFSDQEQADLARLPPDRRRHAFFCCWSRKEAFVKATGEGLSLKLDQFDVSLRPGEPEVQLTMRPDPAEAGRWAIRHLDIDPAHAAAVAAEGRNWRLETLEWRSPGFVSGSSDIRV
jgi:4'-phosphopantetheinyl transferase